MKSSTITIKKSTKKRLSEYGNINSTFDSVIRELLDHTEKCDIWWVDRN